MKKHSLIATSTLLFGLGINLAQAAWCGYSEFVKGNANLKNETEILWIRANTCNSGAGDQILTITSADGAKTCKVSNSTIASNLFRISEKTCKDGITDAKAKAICDAAYQAIKVPNPDSLKKNPAYSAIFGCQ